MPIDWRHVLGGAADRAQEALAALGHDAWADDMGIGADGTTTSRADAAAEAAALDFLIESVPGVSICSEEAGIHDGGGDTLLIVDPVDGTNNAVRGIPYWAFSVGVVVDGEPVAGFVRNVPAQVDYFACDGTAFVGDDPVVAGDVTKLGDATLVLQRPAEPGALDLSRTLMASCTLARMLGAAALDLAAVGAGQAHGYVNANVSEGWPFGEKVVDYAGAAVFTAAAGGVVTDANGMPPSFEPDLAARTVIVSACTSELHAQLLEILNSGS